MPTVVVELPRRAAADVLALVSAFTHSYEHPYVAALAEVEQPFQDVLTREEAADAARRYTTFARALGGDE